MGSGGGRLTERRKVPPPFVAGSRKGRAERHGSGTETTPAGGNAMMPKGEGHSSRMKRADPAGASR